VIETDLGERIQQLDNEDPSHVVVPAVQQAAHRCGKKYSHIRSAPTLATPMSTIWRKHSERRLAPLILNADAGMTGANFVVAETGTFVVCTNEGNADLSANVPRLPHRLDRHREDHSAPGAFGGVRPPLVAQAPSGRR